MEELKRRAKQVAGWGGGIGGVALAVQLLTSQVSALDKKIDDTVLETHNYVDSKHELVMTEIKHLGEGQEDVKRLLRTIERRMYYRKYGPTPEDE